MQHTLLKFLETWKITADNRGFAGAFMMDLSKTIAGLNHGLLLAKLYAYGFSKIALILINSYLSKRGQRVKVNGSFTNWREANLDVPQGSVQGPIPSF